MLIRRFLPEDLMKLALQDEQRDLQHIIDNPQYGIGLGSAGDAFTAEKDGVILGCAGVQEHNPIRAEAWALLSSSIGPYMRIATRAAIGWFEQCKYERIEANVATDFIEGLRWVKLLGFKPEGSEREKFFADGRSAITYVRFK